VEEGTGSSSSESGFSSSRHGRGRRNLFVRFASSSTRWSELIDLSTIISALSLVGVVTLGALQVYYARNRVTFLQLKEERHKIEYEVHNLINQSILEGNIGRTLDTKLDPIKQDVGEIKDTLAKIDDRLRSLEAKK